MRNDVDARGLECPKPVIEAKKVLDTVTHGRVDVLVDNMVAVENLKRFALSQGCTATYQTETSGFLVMITKGKGMEGAGASASPEDQGVSDGKSSDREVVFFAQATVGGGDALLGAALMKSYIYTLTERETLPKALVFMNEGVLLTCADSPVLENLKILLDQGVEMFSCGTCLDFYGRKGDLAVGRVSNMYEIVEVLHGARRVIRI